MRFPYTGNVSQPVQCRDLANDKTRHQKAEDLLEEVSTSPRRTHLVGHVTK